MDELRLDRELMEQIELERVLEEEEGTEGGRGMRTRREGTALL